MEHLPIFFVFFFLWSMAARASSMAVSGLSSDAQNLISFKGTLQNPRVLQNWIPNQNPCDFTGVLCNSSRVSSISLSNITLSSDFSSVASLLLSLENLESLVLKFANLTGDLSVVPAGFSCSKVLNELDLAGNEFSGDFSGLRYCGSLKFLNLSGNSLGFSGGGNGGFKLDLHELDLSFNRFSGQNLLPWIFSGGCANLQYLNLKGNEVSGKIPVADCGNLAFLDISSNNFSGEFPVLGDCKSLQHLDLASNRFSGVIGDGIAGCTFLKFLNLSDNHFSGGVPAISSGGSLQHFLVSNNNLEGTIPTQLAGSCSNLLSLNLSFNNLVGPVPDSLSTCSALESIDLSSNNISGSFPAQTLSAITGLKKLVLSFNNLVGFLPDSLSELANLEILDLSSNWINGSIPVNLCQNPRNNNVLPLKELYLQNNQLTGMVPPSLSNCSQLVSLDLSFNYLTGTIPPSFGDLNQLQDLIMWLNQLRGTIPPELANIRTLENLILDNNWLTGSIPAGLSNCSNLNWISLSSNLLSGEIPSSIGQLSNLAILQLGNNSLSGRIPPKLGDCKSLVWLDLNSNNLSGTIPASIANQSGKIAVGLVTGKRYIYMKNDGTTKCHGAGNLLEFAGIRSQQLNRIPTYQTCNMSRVYMGSTKYTFNNNGSMIFLDLSYNFLEGSIPKEIGNMFYLMILNLGHNSLSGPIPSEIGNLKSVGVFDLSHNHLQGPIPASFSGLTLLSQIDLSNNNLTGLIPELGQLGTFPASSYQNNSGLCGFPLPPCSGGSSSSPGNLQHQKSHRKQASLAGSVAMGLLFSLFCIFGLIIVAIENRRKRKTETLDIYIDSHTHSGTANVSWKLTGAREALSINLATFEKPLRKLTFADLLEATNGFHNDSLIGSGGFGDVYKAQLKDGSIVAIKKLIHISGQGDREFTAEMETIGKIKHRNLVPLLGYCKVKEERLLVYEYMRFGSLEDILHDQKKGGIKLDWPTRKKIAVGAARGLAFLHHNCIPHIIHRDMKSSNVLVDENMEARVSDFGMARLMSAMDTHLSVSTLAGTPGYVPPEYYQSFRCSTKGDVYSYGVVLLELLTGKQPTDSADFGDNNLVGWVKQHAKLKITDVFDPELMKDPSLELELRQHLKIATACLDDRPWLRPTMIQVMAMFKEIQTGSAAKMGGDLDGSFGVAVIDAEDSLKETQEPETKE